MVWFFLNRMFLVTDKNIMLKNFHFITCTNFLHTNEHQWLQMPAADRFKVELKHANDYHLNVERCLPADKIYEPTSPRVVQRFYRNCTMFLTYFHTTLIENTHINDRNYSVNRATYNYCS